MKLWQLACFMPECKYFLFCLLSLDKLDGVLRRKRCSSEEEESLTLTEYLKRKKEEYDGDGRPNKKRVP